MSPKQTVLAKYPLAKAEWVPGWGLWRIANCGAPETTGFYARQAWQHAARDTRPSKKRGSP